VATGTVRFRQFSELAIVGGTNLYNDARGTLTIIRTTHSPRPIRELLYFRLAGQHGGARARRSLFRLGQLAARLGLRLLADAAQPLRFLQRQAEPPRHEKCNDRQHENEHPVDPDLSLVGDPEGDEDAIRSPREEDHEDPG